MLCFEVDEGESTFDVDMTGKSNLASVKTIFWWLQMARLKVAKPT